MCWVAATCILFPCRMQTQHICPVLLRHCDGFVDVMDLSAWDPAVRCVGSCPLLLIGLTVVVTTTPGRGWKALRRCIQEEEARTSTPFTWHYQYWPWNLTRLMGAQSQGYFFSVNQIAQAACQTAPRKGPENNSIRTMSDYTQLWDGFLQLTLGYGHLSIHAPLC